MKNAQDVINQHIESCERRIRSIESGIETDLEEIRNTWDHLRWLREELHANQRVLEYLKAGKL